MPPTQSRPHTVGAASFDPDAFFEAWSSNASLSQNNDLRSCIINAFNLKSNDGYVYHATAAVTLAQVQTAINYGGQRELHAWYRDEEGKPISPPPPADISAYTAIFSPHTSTAKALTALRANAKKESLRARIAAHLSETFFLPSTPLPGTPTTLTLPPKLKPADPKATNPYYDIWAWTCHTLEWAGPEPGTEKIHQSHHILPVLYHHFGCVCPSYDALALVAQLTTCALPTAAAVPKGSPGREVIEIGSGGGYWTHLLRRLGVRVMAVDNAASRWRTTWIGDTIIADGVEYLRRHNSGKNTILLLVYPQVSEDFTGKVLRAFEGDVVVVAGTQNRNRFTGFREEGVGEWMGREKGEMGRVAQVPLPSFAGKDEALFVFVRGAGEGGG
ncbi:hypothetical protein H2201_006484 [Coniosporium apollinis]|uniref:Methyltransferase type 11 domain-containing protein n=1 Tax=Coniosporium apollinis TaxID=61459 RepID=A0ABQ9NLY0_9PEZI|nr:hypothetical protein H2201_006484 [Coniosporium apollinis]